jgi:hypothetical protein
MEPLGVLGVGGKKNNNNNTEQRRKKERETNYGCAGIVIDFSRR